MRSAIKTGDGKGKKLKRKRSEIEKSLSGEMTDRQRPLKETNCYDLFCWWANEEMLSRFRILTSWLTQMLTNLRIRSYG